MNRWLLALAVCGVVAGIGCGGCGRLPGTEDGGNGGGEDSGEVFLWDDSNSVDGGTWAQVSARGWHTCATRRNGTLWCWGRNFSGELGNGTQTDNDSPVFVDAGVAKWAQVSTGIDHTCATRTDHTLWCWGSNASGSVGDGTRAQRLSPTQVAGAAGDWAQVSAGGWHTCATRMDGTLWCWGNNWYGQLGNGTDGGSLQPTLENAGAGNWALVSAGDDHTCATRTDGTLWCWGSNSDGQLGDGTDAGYRLTPVQVVGGIAIWASVSSGYLHTCARRGDDTLWCWGNNGYGQLGDGTSQSKFFPVQVDGGAGSWAQVSAGMSRSCATRTDGTLWCWGYSSYLPVAVGATNWAQVSVGAEHRCGMRTDGTLWCWGSNQYGQLGNGTDAGSSAIPVQVK